MGTGLTARGLRARWGSHRGALDTGTPGQARERAAGCGAQVRAQMNSPVTGPWAERQVEARV